MNVWIVKVTGLIYIFLNAQCCSCEGVPSHVLRARNRIVLQKCSYPPTTTAWTWSSGESLLLLSRLDLAFLPLRVRISYKEPQHLRLPCSSCVFTSAR